MANRLPAYRRQCEGVGYIIVGASPSGAEGVAPIDPADLEPRLARYLGSADGPVWSATQLTVSDANVLVVAVEARRPDEPIWPLAVQFENHSSGTVFSRQQGRTAPIEAGAFVALQRDISAMALASTPDLFVGFEGDSPLSWLRWNALEERLGRYASVRGVQLRNDGARRESEVHRLGYRARSTPPDSVPLRTLESYAREVDEWVPRFRNALKRVCLGRFASHGNGVIQVVVGERSGKNLHDVELRVRFPTLLGVHADVPPWDATLPDPPPAYEGVPTLVAPTFEPPSRPLITGRPSRPVARVERSETWTNLIVDVGALRPEQQLTACTVFIMVPEQLRGSDHRLSWSATASNADGVMRGEVQLPIAEDPVELEAVWIEPQYLDDDYG